jgi:streptomycin 6-kinase
MPTINRSSAVPNRRNTARMINDTVRRTVESWGPFGLAWIDALPAIVEDLQRSWSLTLGDVLDGGKASLVMRVRRAGEDAVLKIAPPGPQFARQVAAIAAADGRGYFWLLDVDDDHHAMLLEPLGAMLAERATSPEQVLDILSATLLTAWTATPPPLPREIHKASSLGAYISEAWEDQQRPCSQNLIKIAIRYAHLRAAAFDPATDVLCHGDPHWGNALEVTTPRPGAESGFVFVDPDGFVCDRGYDLGVVLRAWTDEVLAAADPEALLRGYCARMEANTGVDAEIIWQWGFIERISTGLYLTQCGHPVEGRTYLDSAERLV